LGLHRIGFTPVPRKINLHGRALAGLAVDFHVTGRLPDEAIDLAEAKTRALADILGREERLERLLQGGFIHACAGVGYRDHDVLA
jgi:hypothetical protein